MTKEVFSHIRDLNENIKDWESYLKECPENAFISDRKTRHALLHAVTVAIQAAIDIGNHWVSEITSERPESYRTIANLLAERNAIPANLRKNLQNLFSLRNVLIHKYQELDLSKLYSKLHNGIEPLKIFLKLAKAKFIK